MALSTNLNIVPALTHVNFKHNFDNLSKNQIARKNLFKSLLIKKFVIYKNANVSNFVERVCVKLKCATVLTVRIAGTRDKFPQKLLPCSSNAHS